ncbi:SGNH/GDSL hydrolase family protein [Lentilactobacillus parabuchneri]|uniref:SGNH/GDSL hydrolase family protein n=1 Tax=Lentilactobacillus parabuchneri TaxID=152331 RepID=A0A844EKN6_9LACO|nr:SGNH/GDSL hydrolase family protein [Lentilactobacillus parabuchneri]MBW0246603.1 SGNH/GDSL hydrolase family protein [Lentilactobacillus parabuchneri]MBW0264603.1 SGNH/GDSL hydrolase family protein [Lentilactobacillus parabuchneri]MCT2884361.1 SGNH/GDSL hydrolase family protein [Lentilactobacillus parabuchneri]MSE20064.1 SGNH/GDSL hydrolase family protein [Lentilactobacillus parabuchneri]
MVLDEKYFADKTINCLGDSTTWGDDSTGGGGNAISWTSHLQELIPFKQVNNFGKKGSRIALSEDRQDSFVERYLDMDKSADYIVVFGGINDFVNNVPIGTIGNKDPHKFLGALDIIINGLNDHYPDAVLIFMTATKSSFAHSSKPYPNSFQKNAAGNTQANYNAAMIDICHHYSLPVIDLFNISGISPFLDNSERYMPDGTHYSPLGYKKLAHRIVGELIRYLI